MSNVLESIFEYKSVSIVIPIVLAVFMLVLRKRSVSQPLTLKVIFLPTLFMGSGFLMYIFPFFHISFSLVIEAVSIGIVLSIILIGLTKFEVKGNRVYLLPSKYLFTFLFGFIVVRLLIKLIIGSMISVGQTAGMFFLLAFTTLFTWRIFMAIKYNKIKKKSTL